MISRMLIPALLGFAVALPAAAAPATADQSNNIAASSGQNGGPATPRIASKIRNNLEQAGFTDIHVVPQSFLVQAKDKQGNPAMMVVTPDSFTMVTAMNSPMNGRSQSAQRGSVGTMESGTKSSASGNLGNNKE